MPVAWLVIELLTSDPAILLMCGAGLVATAISIVRDTQTQRANAVPDRLAPESLRPEQLRDAA